MDEALRAVADPTRRAILRLVRDDEWAAGTIAEQFPGMSRPAVSQHLRVLFDAGLVDVRRDGNRLLYRTRPEGMSDAAAFFDEFWAGGLARLKAAAEREEWPKRQRAKRSAARQPAAKPPAAKQQKARQQKAGQQKEQR